MLSPDASQFIVNIPDHLNTEEIRIPPLLIQPFIENSFKHAFKGEMDRMPEIELSIGCQDRHLNINIRDNGKGMMNPSDSRFNTRLGMKLANERMEILNSLKIDNNIAITPATPYGTNINITIIKMT